MSDEKLASINYARTFENQLGLSNNLPKYIAPKDYKMADTVYKHIAEQIKDFQDSLDTEHEVGIMLASFGQPVMLAVEDIGFQNPNLIYFYGTINGNQTQLIQHMSQVNLVLTAVAKQPDKPARRIGFHVD